jgi:hypothetical protein
MAFTFKPRDQAVIDKKETQQANDLVSFIREEYKIYKVRKGENLIRILPQDAKWEREDYGETVFVHFGIGPDSASVLCNTRMGGGACCICEARAKAERAGDDRLANDLRITKRVVVWILDRKAQDDEPTLWSMPWTVDKDITKASKDRMTGRTYTIEHPDEGYDIYFDKDGEGLATKYTGFQMARSPTRVPESALNFVSENPVLATLNQRSNEEVQAIFQGVVSQGRGGRDNDRPRDGGRPDRTPPRDDTPPPASEHDYGGGRDHPNAERPAAARPERMIREERPSDRPPVDERPQTMRPMLTRPTTIEPTPPVEAPTPPATLSAAALRARLNK